MNRQLRIVLIHPPHESEARAHALQAGLAEAGYDLIASLPADFHLPEHIARLQPDMIIVDAESDARDVLEHIVIATRDERRPIVRFTEDDKADSLEAAMAAGSGNYGKETVEAVYYTRRVWIRFIEDLGNPENQLDDELRAELPRPV